MNAPVTPLHVEIALHYVCCPGDFPRLHAPACRDAVEDFRACGLIEPVVKVGTCARWRATEGLRVWVQRLCKTPFPRQEWV